MAVVLGSGATARADSLTFSFNQANIWSGGAPADTSTWLTATFTDTGVNTVSLTLSASGPWQDSKGNVIRIDNVYFNLDPHLTSLLSGGLTFGRVSGPAASIIIGEDVAKADGDGFYDIFLNYGNSFPSGSSAKFTITGTGISASSFDFLSTENKTSNYGPFDAAIHLTGYNDNGGSAWVYGSPTSSATPDGGSTIGLLGLALISMGLMRRKGLLKKADLG